ncbi:CoA pyrophosphatase [Methylobacterium sp. NEAU 140]|uniref:CoA pyrophosphatase n=1 Tax=Methylobacterium sp. NEAU 140 TaxID=3064945 RepID=UPI0027346E00|nr:CoA pyrophosphatase [Methylobacterium sp. NEAU 140]MDP4024869.1 CoA pyrophosphatase [Methylobacterium sp. NEAU 140]
MNDRGASDPLAEFLARAAAGLSPTPPGPDDPTSNPRGDHSLDPDGSAVIPPPPHRRAAVLVPVVFREGGPTLVLTLRAAGLRQHSGQVALPGGKIDPDDPGPAAAALREAHEEIGLEPDAVRVLGYLDPYLSGTAFLVTPVIGLVAPGAAFRPNPEEVAEVFEVPLPVLMDPERYVLRSREWQGRNRWFYAMPFGERLIWGVTAGILNNLRERLYPEGGPAPGDSRPAPR